MSAYLHGTDVLGFGTAPSEQYIVIRFTNLPKLVKDKGGAAGGIVQTVLPTTIANKVYDETLAQMKSEFAKQGIDAEVKITTTPPLGNERPKSELVPGIAIGAGGAAIVYGIFRGISYLLKRS